MNIPILKAIRNSFREDGSLEQLIEDALKNNNLFLVRILINQANSQRPIEDTWNIIKELHAQEYTNYIGSNISRHAFKELVDGSKNPTLAPIFTYFNLDAPQTADDSKIIKPNVEFYKSFLRKNDIDLATTQVIFIDDRIKNVVAAASVGFIGLLFTNPEQLRTDLVALGITIAPKSILKK